MAEFVSKSGRRYKIVMIEGEPYAVTDRGYKWICRWWGKSYCFSGAYSIRVVGTLRVKAGSSIHV